MSVPPPGAAPPKPTVAAPTDANAGRGDRFREITRGLWFKIGLGAVLILAGAAFVASGNPILALAAIGAGVVLVVGAAFVIADRRAEDDFFAHYASYRGMVLQPDPGVTPLTPLLSRGDRSYYEHFMTGPLRQGGGPQCALAHYTYITIERHTDSNGNTTTSEEKHPFTVCIVDVAQAATMFPAIDLTPTIGGFFGRLGGKISDVLDGANMRKVELESSQLANQHHLTVSSAIDDVRIRELFTPQFIVWLTQNFADTSFELRTGRLVVYVQGHAEERSQLDGLLERAAPIVQRLLEEVAEEPGGAQAPAIR